MKRLLNFWKKKKWNMDSFDIEMTIREYLVGKNIPGDREEFIKSTVRLQRPEPSGNRTPESTPDSIRKEVSAFLTAHRMRHADDRAEREKESLKKKDEDKQLEAIRKAVRGAVALEMHRWRRKGDCKLSQTYKCFKCGWTGPKSAMPISLEIVIGKHEDQNFSCPQCGMVYLYKRVEVLE